MRVPRLSLALAVLAGVWLVPGTAARGAAQDDAVAAQVRVIEDGTVPDSPRDGARGKADPDAVLPRRKATDDERAAARDNLVTLVTRGEPAALNGVLKLGETTTNDRVRLDVAFVLAKNRLGKSIVPPAQIPAAVKLLSGWLEAKDGNAGVRFWAAVGLANTQSENALPLLKEHALKPDSDPVIRVAVARALAGWRGDALAKFIVPILVEFLQDKDPDMRIAGCDALRLTDQDSEETVEPVLKAAKEDRDERVWRAAVVSLRRLGGGALLIAGGAEEADRQQKLQAWENLWRRKKRLAAKEKE